MSTNTCLFNQCIKRIYREELCLRHYVLRDKKKPVSQYQKYQYHKLYNTRNWQNLRVKKIDLNPLCEKCGLEGNQIDHIIDHKGNIDLFYDLKNLQTLCISCHSRKTMTTNNIKKYKNVDETVNIIIGNESCIEKYEQSMNMKGNEEYLLDLIVKGSKSLTFRVKTMLEAIKLKQAFIRNHRVKPIFKITEEVKNVKENNRTEFKN